MLLAKHGKGMLSSIEQAFVGRDEKRASLKKPAWEANAYGVAISFAHTVNVTLDNNLCGLKLSQDMHWLSDQVEPKRYWSGQKSKLEFLKTHYHLQDDQGYFKSCLYEHCDEGMQIEKNVSREVPILDDTETTPCTSKGSTT